MIPQTYEAWVHCITISCKIPLTRPFLSTRIASLRDQTDDHTRRYVALYGEAYHERVIGWFEQALETLIQDDAH